MDCNKDFAHSYMLLKPEEVNLFDLFKILFSTDIENRKFVDSKAKDETFERRWLMFISIVVQKLLQFGSKPLSWVGSWFEMCLNLVSSNRNIGVLFLNVFQGSVVVPSKTSAAFISFIGNFDKRVELDSSIKHGDGSRYFAALSMMASKASYENIAYIKTIVQDHWKMEFLGSYDFWNDYQEKATTQAFLLRDKTNEQDTIVVAFRGTEPFDADAWCSDFDISWYEIPGVGNIHGGFMKSLGLQKSVGWPKETSEEDDKRPAPLAYYAIREILREIMVNNETKFILTGHSQGGSLAILFPAVLALHEEKLLLERLEGVYTFGQPRVGDERFGQYMEKMLRDRGIKYFRFVYGNDVVPRLPYDDKALMFKHFGTCVYYDRHYEGKIVGEEPNKNYFSPLRAIPMMINAFFELIRSFTISYTKGHDYKEGWLLWTFRVIGLVVPGLPAHSTQDYVNATRLGSPELLVSTYTNITQ
ncbi:triacylglycerol lipase OBL1-like [Tripterygium wilfordii]|uniref:triacylglycerol lipase OBL1-like n=1 Tax=Tripterygium wilfordii TaxID=458696 RepID=UPI0018F7E624|nr:triacylglycerol lipase OBL1-like [Tripterygium wilfordii]